MRSVKHVLPSLIAGMLCGLLGTASAWGAPTISDWKSRLSHNGTPLDISLHKISTVTEPRRGGIQKLRVSFSEPVQATDGTLDGNDVQVRDAALFNYTPVLGLVDGGATLEISFPAAPAVGALADRKTYTFTLIPGKFCSVAGCVPLTPDADGKNDCRVRALIGDLDSNGIVDSADQAANKALNGQTAGAANAKFDVNTDGKINLIDVALTKSKAGGNADQACSTGVDCGSGACGAGVCVPTCTDGVLDGTETDVDCGGDCPSCAGPVDCVVGDWSTWSACSTSCGGGIQTRTRTVVTPAANGGNACPVLEQTQSCNTQPCQVDCVVSGWSEWSACSTSCGGGTRVRTRTVVTPAAYGGAACPALVEATSCNTQPCPVDCVVADWSSWTPCSESCGGGTQTRNRNVVTYPAYGGAACPALVDNQSCNAQPCPVDCVMSAWSEWGPCSDSCGGGFQKRTRSVVTPAAFGGAPCPMDVEETRACNLQACGFVQTAEPSNTEVDDGTLSMTDLLFLWSSELPLSY